MKLVPRPVPITCRFFALRRTEPSLAWLDELPVTAASVTHCLLEAVSPCFRQPVGRKA